MQAINYFKNYEWEKVNETLFIDIQYFWLSVHFYPLSNDEWCVGSNQYSMITLDSLDAIILTENTDHYWIFYCFWSGLVGLNVMVTFYGFSLTHRVLTGHIPEFVFMYSSVRHRYWRCIWYSKPILHSIDNPG